MWRRNGRARPPGRLPAFCIIGVSQRKSPLPQAQVTLPLVVISSRRQTLLDCHQRAVNMRRDENGWQSPQLFARHLAIIGSTNRLQGRGWNASTAVVAPPHASNLEAGRRIDHGCARLDLAQIESLSQSPCKNLGRWVLNSAPPFCLPQSRVTLRVSTAWRGPCPACRSILENLFSIINRVG
jgi:hypothetical protein